MAENSKIEWCEHTFNPWEGCQKVGPGCDHCYAEARNARFGGGTATNWGVGAPRRRTSAANWRKPLAWNAEAGRTGIRPRVFCASLADVFDNEVDPAWRVDLFELIRVTPNLDWLLLTKRIGNAGSMIDRDGALAGNGTRYLPDNVWLGATVVNQAEADRDIPKLLALKESHGARRVFLSMEPLLGAVNIEPWLDPEETCQGCDDGEGYGNRCNNDSIPRDEQCPWKRAVQIVVEHAPYDAGGVPSSITSHLITLDWVIVGGESGPHARPMHPDWARSLRDQCAAAGVPFLFKQWGEWFPYGEIDADGHQNSRTRGEDPRYWQPLEPGKGFMVRIGKQEAGRFLDGVQHDGVPTKLAATPDQA